ncbi:hypothetical protein AO067_00715 [Pseudomonas viridiflava ICMP 13104]|uniref:Uncharacterized protein n=1 Tax=Pseudomonas viridiflava ICMP 13104 TaxID=1198305 RepID=A0A0W0HA62_PSEVI|nr:hypothetical protein AO067_00715 [Pseudomonas viridiflava ICMP 13104]
MAMRQYFAVTLMPFLIRNARVRKKMAMRQYFAVTLMPFLIRNAMTVEKRWPFEYSSHVPERPRSI